MKFVLHAQYGVDRQTITRALAAHTTYAESMIRRRKLAAAGPYMNERGDYLGVHFVYDADSLREAETLVRNDPFALHGIVGDPDVREWHLLGHDRRLLDILQRRLGGHVDGETRTFLNCVRYVDDSINLARVRPAHHDYAKALRAQGRLVMAGPFADDIGAVLVYEAASREEALGLVREDPFSKEGLFADIELSEWEVRGLNIDLFED